MRIETEETVFKAPTQFNVLPKRKFQKFLPTDTTPNVRNHEFWLANNSGAVTVTQFDDGAEGQELNILGDGNTTIAHNSNIKTNTGANKLLATDRMYRFIKVNSLWVEQ